MPVSVAEHKQAQLFDRDLGKIVRRGLIAAGRIGWRAQQASIAALRRRGGDPVGVALRQLDRAVPLLRDAMIVAHHQGVVRSAQMRAARVPSELSLEAPYVESMRVMRQWVTISPVQMKELGARYETEALRVLTTMKTSVQNGLQQTMLDIQMEGLHRKDAVKALSKAFKKEGLTPRNSFTLEAIFRTQSHIAYSAGRWHANQDPAIQEILWGHKYVTVGDDRVRPEHEALDGTTLPKNDPQWNLIYPPNGWACRCQVIDVFDEGEEVRPPSVAVVDGREVIPGADQGFRFHPGKLFGSMEPPQLTMRGGGRIK